MKKMKPHLRHRALSIASVFFAVFGSLMIVLGIFGVAMIFISYKSLAIQIAGTAATILASLILAIVFYALSNVIDVILDMFDHIHEIKQTLSKETGAPEAEVRTIEREILPEEKQAAG